VVQAKTQTKRYITLFAVLPRCRKQRDEVKNTFFEKKKKKFKMSWGEYLSNLQRDGLKSAAICGLDGASWIQVTEGSNVSLRTSIVL